MVITSKEELTVNGRRYDVVYSYGGSGYWTAKVTGLDMIVGSASRQECERMIVTNIEYLLDTVAMTDDE